MSFKKLRGVNLPEKKQGLIRYTCLNILDQPVWMRKKFERLCVECGGVYHCALREILTTERSVTEVALKYHVDESVIYRARKSFYENW